MNRPKLVITALATSALLLSGVVVLRSSGLATDPARALAAVPHGAWFSPYNAPDDLFVVRMIDDAATWEGRYGNVVDTTIYHLGVYEKGEVFLLRKMLREMGGSFLDVGANMGNHSFALARDAEAVHAIEPWPPVVARLRRTAELNPDLPVHIHPVGYSNEPGTLPFHPPPEGAFGIGSFDATFLPEGRGEPILLPLVAGDVHLAEVGAGRIGLMKVDIEGYERYALEGLAQTLRRDRPAVLFELNLTEGGFTDMAQVKATFPVNYSFYEIDIDPPWLLDFVVFGWFYGSEATGRYHLIPLSHFHRSNVVALPDERNLFDALR